LKPPRTYRFLTYVNSPGKKNPPERSHAPGDKEETKISGNESEA